MKNVFAVLLGPTVVGLGLAAGMTAVTAAPQQPAPAAPAKPAAPATATASTQSASLISTYCVSCHSDKGKAGGLSLASFDAAHAEKTPEVTEKVIRKLTAGMMPPAGMKRPDAKTMQAFVAGLETKLDTVAAANPNPGWRPFQRLTRAEYAHAVKDLLDLDVDTTAYLPPDTISHGFDNVADAQSFSPTLFEGYLRAAGQISRLAVGDRNATPTSATYRIPQFESQMRHVEGTPFGARGGMSVVHTFPADGTYVFKVILVRTVSGELFGNTAIALQGENEPVEVLINGDRAAMMEIHSGLSDADEKGMTVESPPVHVKAGPQRVAIVFPKHFEGPIDDLLTPIDSTLIDTRIGTGFGVTAAPHVQDVTIAGPVTVTGVSDTPSRRRVFTCRPTSAAEETTCATEILTRLSSQAYRAPVGKQDFADLMKFYNEGRASGDFEGGIRLALQGMLANPRFLFRAEQTPAALKAAQSYRVSDIELASRLSFFLWGTVPDAELVQAAMQSTLKTPAVFEKQVRRMLADPRSEALSVRFASQWLRLQDVDKIRPDGLLYPYWDRSLSQAFRRETELFFDNLVREDRSLLELLTADYSFVNERIARHYGIPNVTGNDFRRVTLPESRRGILGHGSILLLTSVADRTSPVQRGKWVMQVLLGSPPPPPPPGVPLLEETKGNIGTRVLTVRERMEEHRKNPACTSCHKVIDPLGLALEHFDVTGKWRGNDTGVAIDSTGQLYDGTEMSGLNGLRDALLKHRETVLRSFTESLMTYALGRRVEYYDMPTVRTVVREASKQDYKLSSFILGVVSSPAFRMSRPGPTETTTVAERDE
jgi:mono/diheme cytochrome c family protein